MSSSIRGAGKPIPVEYGGRSWPAPKQGSAPKDFFPGYYGPQIFSAFGGDTVPLALALHIRRGVQIKETGVLEALLARTTCADNFTIDSEPLAAAVSETFGPSKPVSVIALEEDSSRFGAHLVAMGFRHIKNHHYLEGSYRAFGRVIRAHLESNQGNSINWGVRIAGFHNECLPGDPIAMAFQLREPKNQPIGEIFLVYLNNLSLGQG